MATIFSHPAVPLAIGVGAGRTVIPPRLLCTGVICSVIPDLDVLAFSLEIPYGHLFGHRGFTHSGVFAVLTGLLAAAFHRQLETGKETAFLFVFTSTLSHGVLDALSTGGLGIAFFWPYADRYFFPWQFIDVSPIGLSFFSSWGIAVIKAELIWVWLPALIIGVAGLTARRIRRRVLEREAKGKGDAQLRRSETHGDTRS